MSETTVTFEDQRSSGPVNAHLTPGPGIHFNAFIHVDNPLGTNVDVNRKPLSLCQCVASFKTISLKYDFKHILNDFTHVHIYTGHSRYVDFAYLDTTTYVEVIFHSQHFFSIFLCISTPFMSKTVNMKQRVSRGDFSCLRSIFYYICYCLCRSKNRHSHGHHIVCFGCVHVLAEVRTSSKQQ